MLNVAMHPEWGGVCVRMLLTWYTHLRLGKSAFHPPPFRFRWLKWFPAPRFLWRSDPRGGSSQVFPESSGDLFTEVTGQVSLGAKAAVVGVAAGDERHVDVEQRRSAVAWEAGEPGGWGETFKKKGMEGERKSCKCTVLNITTSGPASAAGVVCFRGPPPKKKSPLIQTRQHPHATYDMTPYLAALGVLVDLVRRGEQDAVLGCGFGGPWSARVAWIYAAAFAPQLPDAQHL